jgi:hypothetical protein
MGALYVEKPADIVDGFDRDNAIVYNVGETIKNSLALPNR